MSFSEIPRESSKALSEDQLEINQVSSTATHEDIKARIILQYETYLKREEAGELSPSWRRYERRHSEEINAIREKLENEASF